MGSMIVGIYCKAIGVVALVQHVLCLFWRGFTCKKVGLALILSILETSEEIVGSRYSIPMYV